MAAYLVCRRIDICVGLRQGGQGLTGAQLHKCILQPMQRSLPPHGLLQIQPIWPTFLQHMMCAAQPNMGMKKLKQPDQAGHKQRTQQDCYGLMTALRRVGQLPCTNKCPELLPKEWPLTRHALSSSFMHLCSSAASFCTLSCTCQRWSAMKKAKVCPEKSLVHQMLKHT